MQFYYAGYNATSLFSKTEGSANIAIDEFSCIPIPDITNLEMDWNYFLVWKNKDLFVLGTNQRKLVQLKLPKQTSSSFVDAIPGKHKIIILLDDNDLWQYNIPDSSWKRVIDFIPKNEDSQEYVIKISQTGSTVALTNLGRVFNIPVLVNMPKRVKFIDIVGGFDHIILLAENGDVYSMGMGTRGQLGHGDLEDSDDPQLVEALAGLKVVQISAGGWHSAVITDQGDLYTWGWNTNGELGIPNDNTKVTAVPTLVELKIDRKSIELPVKRVQCGNVFTICMLEDKTLWGCGSNKYGQLGQCRKRYPCFNTFVKLELNLNLERIINFKCREWGTVVIIE